MSHSLDDLLHMDNVQLHAIVEKGHPLDVHALADTAYTGIDLSMPALFHRIAWKSFRKTFHRDPTTGVLRGWNVMVEQVGWDTPPPPKRDRAGLPKTFGHYEVREARGQRFPRGWTGGHYLDYAVAGNTLLDFPARCGFCPLVAVNEGDMELLLGWEVFKLAGVLVPIPDYWLLKREGPLAEQDWVPRPDQR